MKIVCAWCKNIIEGDSADQDVSHGICPSCLSDKRSKPGRTLSELLEDLEEPVLLVNDEGVVISENHKAESLLGKDKEAIEGFRGGDVFDCIYASKPGGCGSTVHCKSCTIRYTVEETFRTGYAYNHIPATLKINKDASVKDISSYISTNLAGDVVVLRIEDFKMN